MFAAASARSDGGPSVSGKPCPRLIAPVRSASADISAKIVDVYGRIRSTTMVDKLTRREPEAERAEVSGHERGHGDADAEHGDGHGHDGRSQHHHEQTEGQQHRRPRHAALAQPGELPDEPGIRPAQLTLHALQDSAFAVTHHGPPPHGGAYCPPERTPIRGRYEVVIAACSEISALAL